VPELIRSGRYLQPALGIDTDDDVNQQLSELTGVTGVFVLRVHPGGAGAQAGLEGVTVRRGGVEPGDVIVSVADVPIASPSVLMGRLDDFKVGDTVSLKVQRGVQVREVTVTLQPEG
jgi:S1-C subfamily serine protease